MAITLDGTSGITTPPITLANVALAGTAVAGQFEYNGTAPFFTPMGTQRGIVPGMQYYKLNSDLVGANATGSQNTLGVGVTLSSSTQYYFEGYFAFTKSAGTTSHNLSVLFGGTATLNAGNYFLNRSGSSVSLTDLNSNSQNLAPSISSTTAIVSGSTSATVYWIANCRGVVSVNNGGTFIPQYTLSAAPGGAYSTIAGSYFLIYPIGASGANVNVGTWA